MDKDKEQEVKYETWCEHCQALLGGMKTHRCPRCLSTDLIREEVERE